MINWSIWNDRNDIFHGREGNAPITIVECADRYRVNYLQASSQEIPPSGTNLVGCHQNWKAPPIGSWKVNVDAAMFEGVGSGMGVVIRDHEGSVVRAAVQHVRQKWNVDVIEAKAAALGLSLAYQMGVQSVILESDSLQIISILKSGKVPLSYLGNVITEIVEWGSKFNCISYSYVRRSGNEAAHGMAHYMPISFLTRVWVDMCPDAIADIVSSDLMSDFF
ncbi:uncharacterized protein LOC141638324 [Silene latifolia]|uniref:uncharacterized protein LOC141638324 n=1 Tax=Silene latifolia TaxID=37657 RepID=UPI003D77B296